jgi:hypothetical protein
VLLRQEPAAQASSECIASTESASSSASAEDTVNENSEHRLAPAPTSALANTEDAADNASAAVDSIPASNQYDSTSCMDASLAVDRSILQTTHVSTTQDAQSVVSNVDPHLPLSDLSTAPDTAQPQCETRELPPLDNQGTTMVELVTSQLCAQLTLDQQLNTQQEPPTLPNAPIPNVSQEQHTPGQQHSQVFQQSQPLPVALVPQQPIGFSYANSQPAMPFVPTGYPHQGVYAASFAPPHAQVHLSQPPFLQVQNPLPGMYMHPQVVAPNMHPIAGAVYPPYAYAYSSASTPYYPQANVPYSAPYQPRPPR